MTIREATQLVSLPSTARQFVRGASEYLGYVGVPSGANGHPLSMACWFNLTNNADAQYLVSIIDQDQGANGDFYALSAQADNPGDPLMAWTFRSGTGSDFAATTTGLSLNTWHHGLAVFANAGSRAVYIDGRSKGTNATSLTPQNLSHTAIGTIWRSDNPATYTDGRIADVAIWNVALLDQDAQLLAQGLPPHLIKSSNLVGYWPLNDSHYIGDRDAGPWGLHMTAYNTPTWNTGPYTTRHQYSSAMQMQTPQIIIPSSLAGEAPTGAAGIQSVIVSPRRMFPIYRMKG